MNDKALGYALFIVCVATIPSKAICFPIEFEAAPMPAFDDGTAMLLFPPYVSKESSYASAFEYEFIADFTHSREHGVRVLELGGGLGRGPSFNGHRLAFPERKLSSLFEFARSDLAHRFADSEYRRRDRETPDKIPRDKIVSFLLDGPSAASVRPPQLVVPNFSELGENDRREFQELFDSTIKGDWVVLKEANKAMGEGVHLVKRADAIKRSSDPYVVQQYMPTDGIEAINPENQTSGTYEPTGRVLFTVASDGVRFYVYPITMYWKFRRPVDEMDFEGGGTIFSDSLGFGGQLETELSQSILKDLVPYAAEVAAAMNKISANRFARHWVHDDQLFQPLRSLHPLIRVGIRQHTRRRTLRIGEDRVVFCEKMFPEPQLAFLNQVVKSL